jgi:ubiquinone/menaquinone biosynthesis C-methylase UbiE
VITSLSVIEHGVDIDGFFNEMYRLLGKNGLLYVSTDFWSKKIETKRKDWVIFSKKEINDIVEVAEKKGFKLLGHKHLPNITNKIVIFQGLEFTFISMIFKKRIA